MNKQILKLSKLVKLDLQFDIKNNIYSCLIILKLKNNNIANIDLTPIHITATENSIFEEISKALESVYIKHNDIFKQINSYSSLLANAKKDLEAKAIKKKTVKQKNEEVKKASVRLFDNSISKSIEKENKTEPMLVKNSIQEIKEAPNCSNEKEDEPDWAIAAKEKYGVSTDPQPDDIITPFEQKLINESDKELF